MTEGQTPRRKSTADNLDPNKERARARRLRSRGVRAWILEWVPPTVYDSFVPIQDVPAQLRRVACILPSRQKAESVVEVATAIYLSETADPSYMLAIHRLSSLQATPANALSTEVRGN